MSTIGSVSFWQQDQNYWAHTQQSQVSQSISATLISNMFGATSDLSNGLSSIANQTALDRANSQLTAAVQSALASQNGGSTGSTSSSSSGASSSSSSTSSSSSSASGASGSTPTFDAPASGTGTVSLTTGTSLLSLGILAKNTVTVGDGTFTTTYTSTGKDTVGDLINAINANKAGDARAISWLNSSGQLVIAGKDTPDTITVGGTSAAAIGFAPANSVFMPTSASSSSSTASGSSSSSSASKSNASGATATSASNTKASSSGFSANSALALQTGGTAELLLASTGLAGTLVNILA